MKFFPALLLLFPIAGLHAAPLTFEQAVQPLIAQNCLLCHNEKAHTADLDLSAFHTQADVDGKRELWERILSRVEKGEMPPKGLPRPTKAQLDNFTQYLEGEFARLDANQKPDPGRVTARRLNKFEYNNTVRDLLAVKFKPANDFPADDSGYGFDNNGDVLSLSPVLMEKYLAAAEKIAKTVIPGDELPKATIERHKRPADRHPLPDDYAVKHNFPAQGDYTIRVNVSGRHDPMNLVFLIDGTEAGEYLVDIDRDKPRIAEFKLHVPYGEHTLSAALTFDAARILPPPKPPKPDAAAKKQEKPSNPDPDPSLNYIEVLGPYHPLPPPPSESYKRLFICGHAPGRHTEECARLDLANLANRAYRRPATKHEVDALVHFVEMAQQQGDSFEQGMRVALEATLISPHFLFRVERDPEPSNPSTAHRLTDFELASRLSYFLWSSMPDTELWRLADQNQLRDPQVLTAQVKRMLTDPKSNALVENFAGQWLELRNLNSVKPDPDKFPEFPALRADMRRETELFFDSILHENRGILDFIDGKYSFLNERLAKFYGVPGVKGEQFRRVDLSAIPERSGILTQASVLTVSSYPNRTSPVIRGKYVLENILNDPPPPPPPNVPSLDDSTVGMVRSMRAQLEAHRANPVCASCHTRMDPLGFGLENYDAIGHYRTMDGKFPIDSTGTLPSGKSFTNAAEMKTILRTNGLAFAQCLTEKLMTYGLGRGMERFDKPAIQAIGKTAAADGYRFDTLILEIAKSMPFQMRRGEGSEHLLGQNTTAAKPTNP
jgi:hypothetical protein